MQAKGVKAVLSSGPDQHCGIVWLRRVHVVVQVHVVWYPVLWCALLRRFSVAAGVYNALATRLAGSGDAAVTLEERLQALQDALMQVRGGGVERCQVVAGKGRHAGVGKRKH